MIDATLFTVQTHWEAMVKLGAATVALQRARDVVLLAHGGTLAGASVHILADAAEALVREMGQELLMCADSPDAEVRAFVRLVVGRLHGPQPGGA